MNDRQVHREHDVIVVGAGVAGALIAWRLAESGARVLVLEAGEEHQDRLELVGRYAIAKAKAKHLSTPAEIRPRCVVKRLLAGSDGRIERVEYDRWTPDGSTRERHQATAKIYVLAAHAIETPLILLESRLARKGPVGKHLMDVV